MALPHPHGNASGEIAHNSIYDTGATPGSTGGKFIGFGEEGITANGNRAHWALSENIDYVYQILSNDMAIPTGASFTAVDQGGGGQLKYQISDDVWVGDGTYPGVAGSSDPEGMLMLFAVLDDQYNELDDGAGNEVRVKLIRDSTETNDQYKGGSPFISYFPTNPYVYFHTVNPSTGAEVDASYDIPTGTAVRLLYPAKGNMENLPTDALSRYKVQSATEVEAGAFLQDGTKKMTGDFDADSHDILNPLNIIGPPGLDMMVRSQQDLLIKADEDILFDDQWLSSPVALSGGATGVYQPTASAHNASILKALNSQISAGEILRSNRPLNRTGAFTSSVTPDLTYPALDMMINGEIIQLAGGVLALPALVPGNVYVYYNPAVNQLQSMQGLFPSTLPTGSILVWKGNWSGAVWSNEVDCRWPSLRTGTHEAWYVGDGIGVDFADLDTLSAVLTGGWEQIANSDIAKVHEIVVVGSATVTTTFYLGPNWRLRGASATAAGSLNGYEHKIITNTTFPTGETVVSTGTNCEVRDFQIIWNNSLAHQAAAFGAIYLGNGGSAKNLYFGDSGAFTFASCILLGDNCRVEGGTLSYARYRAYGVLTGDGCHISDVDLAPFGVGAGVALAYVKFGGVDNTVEHCRFDNGAWPANWFVECGYGGNTVQNCRGDLSGVGSKPFVRMTADSATESGIRLLNNRISNGYRFVSSAINSALLKLTIHASGNILKDFASTIFDLNNMVVSPDSSVNITDNNFDGLVAGYVLYANYCYRTTFRGNSLTNCTGGGPRVLNQTFAIIDGNYIEGFGAGHYAVWLDGSYNRVTNNVFDDVGVPANSSQVYVVGDMNLIANNNFSGGVNCETGLYCDGSGTRIHGNWFVNHNRRHIYLNGSIGGAYTAIENNYFTGGIAKEATIDTVTFVVAEASIHLNLNVPYTRICNNSFSDIAGRCIVTCGATPGVNGLLIEDNLFFACFGMYLYNDGGSAGLDEQGIIWVESGGGAAKGNIINGNSILECGHPYGWVGRSKNWAAIYSSAVYATINGNNITGVVGTNDVTYNGNEWVFGIRVKESVATVEGNTVFKNISTTMPCNYYAIVYDVNSGGICSGNIVSGSGAASVLLQGWSGFWCSAGVGVVNFIGNQHRGTMSNMNSIMSYNVTRASTGGVDMGNYAQDHDSGIGGVNILVVGNVNDNLGVVHTVSGLPVAYTANPIADFNPQV